jgi:hypothetical protein
MRAACSGAAPQKPRGSRQRILAALDGMDARGIGHVFVDDLADP